MKCLLLTKVTNFPSEIVVTDLEDVLPESKFLAKNHKRHVYLRSSFVPVGSSNSPLTKRPFSGKISRINPPYFGNNGWRDLLDNGLEFRTRVFCSKLEKRCEQNVYAVSGR
ncbi:hypothetical protein CEXT_595911 [Caerostris extrusa]|uniref:Uncharacterized protein n=1 Tax=Caerostris extrusa TaxID=172846 RepID=A0AAV4XZN6_CAEEX|nr:hypothetical protein CEXT_595911 [Caerostris extrusa]